MKKLLMLLLLAGSMPLASMAQDDVYFVPSKATKKKMQGDMPAFYSGSDRSVDEYNRYGRLNSWYQKVDSDSLGNDIITFQGPGIAPDTSYVDTVYVYSGGAQFADEDYFCTRRMSRWDGFHDPWFYDNYLHYGWYDPWYNPWYYGRYAGWYDPWYYGYAGWYSPWYYGYYGWPYHYGWNYPYWGGGTFIAYHGGQNSGGYTGQRTWNGNFHGNGVRNGYVAKNSRNGSYTHRSNGNRSFGGRTYGNDNRMSNNGNTNRSTVGTRSYGGSFGSSSGSFGSGGFGGHSSGSSRIGGGGGHFGGRR